MERTTKMAPMKMKEFLKHIKSMTKLPDDRYMVEVNDGFIFYKKKGNKLTKETN